MKTTDEIIATVAAKLEVSVEDIISDTRLIEVCFARQVAVTFVWLLGGSYRFAGAVVNRDHATAVHSINVVHNLYTTNKNVKPLIHELCQQLIGENPSDLGSLIESRKSAPRIILFTSLTSGRSSAPSTSTAIPCALSAPSKAEPLPLK